MTRVSIRSEYERHGVRAVYDGFGGRYRNPHEPALRRVIEAAVRAWSPDLSSVLATPHKRPAIDTTWGWSLDGELAVERVRARYCRSATGSASRAS